MGTLINQALSTAVMRILTPLVRILLRQGISYGTFADLAKWVYVDVARQEFGISRRKQSTSRISILTGLSRKEVTRVARLSRPDDQTSAERYNRAARVIAAWRREADFIDAEGEPAALSMSGRGSTFSELVRRFSGDVPARAIRDELIHSGAVEQLKDGRIRLLDRAYIPKTSDADKVHILGTDVSHLISTIDHNLQPDVLQPFFQRKVAYDNLPNEVLPQFRKLTGPKAQAFLEKIDRWLAGHDRDINPSAAGTGRNKAGIGIYYFEEHSFEEDT
jgi:hypothetical protein